MPAHCRPASRSTAAAPPRSRRLPPAFTAVLAAAIVLPLALTPLSQARPAAVHQVIDAATVERLGYEVDASRAVHGGQLLVKVPAGFARDGGPDLQLLAAAPEGERVAFTDGLGHDPAQLLVTRPDGGLSLTSFSGLLGAAFTPDGEFLVAVDGSGSLWRVRVADGAAMPVADGPFAGTLEFAADGRLLLLLLDAVEAPTSSVPVLVDAASGGSERIAIAAEDRLVYRARATPEGLVLVAQRPDGSKEVRMADSARRLAVLPTSAGSTDVSPDLKWLAYEAGASTVVIAGLADGVARSYAAAGRPAFSPDGTRLLVVGGDGASLVELDGEAIETIDGQAVWAVCAETCGP